MISKFTGEILLENINSRKKHFQMKCGLLGSKAGKGRLLDLGRMFANDAKTVYRGKMQTR